MQYVSCTNYDPCLCGHSRTEHKPICKKCPCRFFNLKATPIEEEEDYELGE